MRSNEPPAVREPGYGVANHIRSLPTFGFRHRTTLRYAEHIDFGAQNNATQGYAFAANGLYDPNITGTGHQPKGFDQLMLFFQHFQVLAAKITVQMYSELNAATQAVQAAIAVQRSTSVAGWTSMLESGNTVTNYLAVAPEGSGPIPTLLRNAVKIADFQSLPDIMNDDTTKGTASANPATLVYFVIYTVAQDMGGTPSGTHVFGDVILEYDAVFTEPVLIGQS